MNIAIPLLHGTPRSSSIPAAISPKSAAAFALAKKPTRVITTCTAASDLFGSSMNFESTAAFLFPSCASVFTLPLFTDEIAVSAAAKQALNNISTAKMIICPHMGPASDDMIISFL